MATPAVSVAIFRKNEIALVRHKPGSRQPTDYCGLPGGAVEYGESRRAAAAREVSEETGLIIDANDLEEADMVLYKTRKFRGSLKEGSETIPFWAKIGDVLSGKYKFPEISGEFIPDLMRMLESENVRNK